MRRSTTRSSPRAGLCRTTRRSTLPPPAASPSAKSRSPLAVAITCTIQRLYSILRGEAEFDEDLDEKPVAELSAADPRPKEVAYNAAVPLEAFDFIVTDECHRSIYGLWRQVLEYFDAHLIGLTATPSKQTVGFFHQNLVMEYTHDRAVADSVNVGYEVYRIKTESRPLERQPTVNFPQLLLGVALGKRDKDTLTTLAGRLARLERQLNHKDTEALRAHTGGKTLGELAKNLLNAFDPDVIAIIAGRDASPQASAPDAWRPEPTPDELALAKTRFLATACDPFENNVLRDALAKAKQDAEQTIDTVTIDKVEFAGFDAAAKEKAASLTQSFRHYIEEHKSEIAALQILYSRPYAQRLTESMLKEFEQKLRDTHATWTEDRLWNAFAVTAPAKVIGRSQLGRFADLVSLVRFAHEQQLVLEPFSDSVNERFEQWLQSRSGVPPLASADDDKRQDAASTFTPDQLAWLHLIRDHIATSLSIDLDNFGYSRNQHPDQPIKINPLQQLTLLVDALFTAASEQKEFFAAVTSFIVRLRTILTTETAQLTQQELMFLGDRIEEFFAQYRPTPGSF